MHSKLKLLKLHIDLIYINMVLFAQNHAQRLNYNVHLWQKKNTHYDQSNKNNNRQQSND